MPQPNFVPVRPRTSRSTHKSGVSSSTSTLCSAPLTLMVIATFPPTDVGSLGHRLATAMPGDIGKRRCDRTSLLDRPACRAVRDIRVREFERPPAVVAAARVEFCGMVGESEQVFPQQLIETPACGVERCLGLRVSP